jgi:hypothetical protein
MIQLRFLLKIILIFGITICLQTGLKAQDNSEVLKENFKKL